MDRNAISSSLNQDPGWAAYALADLDPKYQEYCTWRAAGDSVVLEYIGLDPPVLFAAGNADEVAQLFAEVPEGRYQYTFLDQHYALIKPRLEVEIEARMWRMVLDRSSFSRVIPHSTRRLSRSDSMAIEVLTQNQPDSPDAYHPSQLEEPGVFYGWFEDNILIAMAGTHIVSVEFSVAAIGNIFTRPDRRGQGLGTQVTQAVTSHLVNNGFELIVLNVSLTNSPAIRCYDKVGFEPHCQYLEGIGRLSPPNQDILGQ